MIDLFEHYMPYGMLISTGTVNDISLNASARFTPTGIVFVDDVITVANDDGLFDSLDGKEIINGPACVGDRITIYETANGVCTGVLEKR